MDKIKCRPLTHVKKGLTFEHLGRVWKVAAWNDTDQVWICRAVTAFDYLQLSEEKIRKIVGIPLDKS